MRLASLRSLLLLLAMTACATTAPPTAPEPPAPALIAKPPTPTPTPAPAPAPEQLALAPALQPLALTEVLLAPRGIAAIALDTAGGARLWPELGNTATPSPVLLPFTEANWVALAATTTEHRFVVAAIDTAGATRVGQVDINARGAVFINLFELPATDPLLEIHVLDGGERILALGLDHRLRLYDRQGRILSLLDRPSFIPWQLRIAHHAGKPPTIIAVLAGPVRAQPISLIDDTLAISGEARQVALDQGPNHNDLALSPDGSFVTALRRPRAEGRGWYLERIDLASGERRWLAGEVDTKVRPRLHLVEPTRVLLESGSGKGFWVDLSLAQAAPPGTVIDRKQLPRTPTKIVDLPGSTEDTRMWSTVTAGLRVVADRTALIVDPLTSDEHHRWSAEDFQPSGVALDATGERIAWILRNRLLVETLGIPASPRTAVELGRDVMEVAFVDPARLIMVDDRGGVTLRRFDDGAILGQVKALPSWLGRTAYHASGQDSGNLAITGKADSDPILVIPVDASGLGTHRKMTESERSSWPEFGFVPGEPKRQQAQLRAITGNDKLVPWERAAAEDRQYVITRAPNHSLYQLHNGKARGFELLRSEHLQLTPAPGAPRVAIIENTVDDVRVLSVIDFASEPPRKLWSRAFDSWISDLGWSADGSHLAVVAAGGAWVLDATTGALLLQRHHLGHTVQRLPDTQPPTPRE